MRFSKLIITGDDMTITQICKVISNGCQIVHANKAQFNPSDLVYVLIDLINENGPAIHTQDIKYCIALHNADHNKLLWEFFHDWGR